jgi:hypothetical protein
MKNSLHDSRLIGIAYDPSALTLRIEGISVEGKCFQLNWQGAMYWSLDPFEIDNIVFELRKYKAREVPDHLADELPNYVTEAVMTGTVSLYEIDPTTGMGGVIAATELVE